MDTSAFTNTSSSKPAQLMIMGDLAGIRQLKLARLDQPTGADVRELISTSGRLL